VRAFALKSLITSFPLAALGEAFSESAGDDMPWYAMQDDPRKTKEAGLFRGAFRRTAPLVLENHKSLETFRNSSPTEARLSSRVTKNPGISRKEMTACHSRMGLKAVHCINHSSKHEQMPPTSSPMHTACHSDQREESVHVEQNSF
jgi:hypothetical protein